VVEVGWTAVGSEVVAEEFSMDQRRRFVRSAFCWFAMMGEGVDVVLRVVGVVYGQEYCLGRRADVTQYLNEVVVSVSGKWVW
jgi:hypothetical protein